MIPTRNDIAAAAPPNKALHDDRPRTAARGLRASRSTDQR
jgi:hypothetical protein